ncbi:PA14 domain-containing protein [Gaoshiqia sp. Z1-71]|uniref:PA14 domain-containing protein n=1 Tax=Gaoshiqia hydrogeniformans TaxID=3290090 RepID=UPI003BF83AAB
MLTKITTLRCLLGLMLFVCMCNPLSAQNKIQFQFRKDRTFKIAQFTDIHWDNHSPACTKTFETIEHVLKTEKPDLAVLTGDIVTAPPAREGWLAVTKIFIDAKVPFAVTLGNHDAEPEITRDQIFELLGPLPYFAGSKGPELPGCGNYDLPVKSSDGKSVAAVLYCIDSNDYPKEKKVGHYDWIKYDQVGWYRSTSEQYTAQNKGISLPALMFFHIPLPEYEKVVGKETTVGEKNEGIASAAINSGIFASLVEKKDVMGIFVGHDHDNNYIGIEHDIALAFGQVSGADAYGDLERGSRIIELREGEFSFDTWIRTRSGIQFKYNYPSGLATDSTQVEYLPAVQLKNLKPGVNYNYYEGKFTSTDELMTANVLKSGTLKNISLEPAAARDSFAFEYQAWLKIPKKAVYRFYTYSDDGSKLFIDGKEIVNNDGSHGARRAEGKVALDEGYHEFRLLYFEDYMGNELEVGFSSISIRECKIPDDFFYVE